MNRDLFGAEPTPGRAATEAARDYYPTPAWAAERLVELYYADLGPADFVLEPAAGAGHFLQAIPEGTPAAGIELDPARAAAASARTGRPVLVGDFATIALPWTPTTILGNPPFDARAIDTILDRAYRWLPEGGRCGLILPAFALNRTARIARLWERWSIENDALPRELFPRLRFPISFVRFTKDRRRIQSGLTLFADMAAVRSLARHAQRILDTAGPPVWRSVVEDALRRAGGEATLTTLYSAIEGRRPTGNQFWREKIRQTVQRYAERTGPATYRLRGELPQ